ncbi:hypothetical protein Prum_025730 [Phytohabitans rumicis]|uniref:Extracellular solute-binding protein n=1 Tax=Phytohabitans rumicis TaxID=1076125 RepID=A0A6V8L289_9ACTN|nr:extracellular solute-binding protein [Phytohabitans rumicis]GFJ88931.1 hypothetical protein Prum_025730 [Phytohabitans rumicis]
MTRTRVLAALAAGALLATAGCGNGFDDSSSDSGQEAGPAALQILIGSSGQAETKAVQDAAAAWASSSGNTATVTPAQDLVQQLGQAFAGDSPPDVFYVDAGRFADYASVGALEPYGDKISNPDDFYESLRTTFTYDGKFYCAPKDFSTLALQINTDLWTKAGLTDADVPTTWDQLTSVAQKIKGSGTVPLALGTPGTGSARSWCRPAAGSPARTASRPPPTRRRTSRPSSTPRACSSRGWPGTRSSSTRGGPARRSARARPR